MDRRLQWLGHLGHMDDERQPKKMLFGELRKKRWKDQISGVMQAIVLKEDWYKLCQDRKEWLVRCRKGVDEVALCRKKNTCAANRPDRPRIDHLCRRLGDITVHKRFCLSER